MTKPEGYDRIAHAVALKRPRFIRYATARGIFRAYMAPMLKDLGATDAAGAFEMSDGSTLTDEGMLHAVASNRFWGFAHAESNTIRYWVGPGVDEVQVRFFFAHELGHIADQAIEKLRRSKSADAGEMRADAYGWVAHEAERITAIAMRRKP